MFVACNNDVLFGFKKTELPLPGSGGGAMKTNGLPVGDFFFFLHTATLLSQKAIEKFV